MHRLRTVRFSYLYIFAGSALLSGAFLFVAHQAISLLYSHYSDNSDVLFVHLIHWVINHIGTTPSAMILFVTIFCGVYILRSQKIADDLQVMVTATAEIAGIGVAQEIKVLSGGELGEIAANLNRIQRVETLHRLEAPDKAPDRDETHAVALLLRTRAILRALREVEATVNNEGSDMRLHLAAAHEEARRMERFLENLIIES